MLIEENQKLQTRKGKEARKMRKQAKSRYNPIIRRTIATFYSCCHLLPTHIYTACVNAYVFRNKQTVSILTLPVASGQLEPSSVSRPLEFRLLFVLVSTGPLGSPFPSCRHFFYLLLRKQLLVADTKCYA